MGHDRGRTAIYGIIPHIAGIRRVARGGVRGAGTTGHGRCTTVSHPVESRRRRETGRGPVSGSKPIYRACHDAVHACHGSRARLPGGLARTNTKRILGEAQTDATLDAVMKRLAIELMQSLGRKRNILKLNETHVSVLLGPEAESLVTTLLREHGFELLFRGVDWQVPNVQGVARRVLVRRVHRWEVVTTEMLIAHLEIHRMTGVVHDGR